jgi:hypothetical protein
MSEQDATAQDGSTRRAGQGAGPVADLKAEFERVKHTADDVKAEVAAATDDRRGGPATSVEDAVSKAETLRQGIERDVAALKTRIPEGDAAKQQAIAKARTLGPPVGGGLLAITTLIVLWKRRSARKRHDAAVGEQALAIARALARLDREEFEVEEDEGGGRLKWLLLGTVAAGAGTLAWQRSRESVGIDDVFGAPEDDPLRPSDVVS